MNKWLTAGILFAVGMAFLTVIGCAILLGYFVWQAVGPSPAYPPPPVESVEQKRREVAEAFRNADLNRQTEETKAIQAFFDSLGDAIRKQDKARVAEAFDAERMLQEIVQAAGRDRQQYAFEEQFVAGLKQGKGLAEGLMRNSFMTSWDQTQIKRIKFLEDPSEVLVFTRHRNEEVGYSKKRWWLKQRDGQWRIYDYEDLDISFRISTLIGLILKQRGTVLSRWAPFLHRLTMDAPQAIIKEDYEAAKNSLDSITHVSFPPPIEALRYLLLGNIALGQNRPEEALKHYDCAESFNVDLPILDFARARAHNALGEHEKALTHGRKYIETLGDDADAYHEIGAALTALERMDEAADAFRKGLDDQPDHVDNLSELRRVLPEKKKAEIGERFAKLSKPEEHFDNLADEALNENDFETVEVLVSVFAKQAAADDPRLDYYQARIKISKKQEKEAIPLFKSAIARTTDADKRREYVDGFLFAMLDAEQPLEAYHAAPDSDYAFRLLADRLVYVEERRQKLRQLLEVHRRRHAGDVWLHYYEGELHAAAEDYDKAEKAYAAGMAKPLDEETQGRFRNRRVYALFRLGKGLIAYEQVGPKKDTFTQLAWLYDGASDAKRLEALVTAHRKNDPEDSDLPFWEVEVHWLNQKYDDAVQVLNSQRTAILANEANKRKFQDRLIRSLVRLKRVEEAHKEIKAMKVEDKMLRAVVAAARGDMVTTELLLAELFKEEEDSSMFYEDPDLGPLLRSERFRALREKYPPPPLDPAVPIG